MKKVVFGIGLLLVLVGIFVFVQLVSQVNIVLVENKINWLIWEEVMIVMENEFKKVFIDVYIDWCGWCKCMDVSIFIDSDVIEYMNENYYVVKFDVEGKGDKEFRGCMFIYCVNVGCCGVYELVIVLLNGCLGYLFFVYLDEEQNFLKVFFGYKMLDVFLVEMKVVVFGS